MFPPVAPTVGPVRWLTPNAQGTDGPFATLERARDAVRDLKKSKTTDIVVLVREGTYQLKNTVVFGLEDSGEGDSTVTYAAYPGETPVFSSGREIKGWKKVTGELPGLPEEAQGKVWVANVSDRFFTLYDAEGMLPRAQSERFVPLKGGSKTELRFPQGTPEKLAECGRCGDSGPSHPALDDECVAPGLG